MGTRRGLHGCGAESRGVEVQADAESVGMALEETMYVQSTGQVQTERWNTQ